MPPRISLDHLVNHPEPRSFMRAALAWQGTVTPVVLHRVLIAALYAAVVCWAVSFAPSIRLPITPFEYSGAVLGLLLVLRVNAGLDRWWEARKIWGSIVNQTRNLATGILAYSNRNSQHAKETTRWVSFWPFVMCAQLRGNKEAAYQAALIDSSEAEEMMTKPHPPSYLGYKIASMISDLRHQGLDAFAFQAVEAQRALLIDAIGACERIKSTRMPFALAVKTRRFILLFLLLLPFALVDRAGYLTPLVVAVASYPLFSLDEIGAELQNPFSDRNLSHLPLLDICKNIERNVMAIADESSKPSLNYAAKSPHSGPTVESTPFGHTKPKQTYTSPNLSRLDHPF